MSNNGQVRNVSGHQGAFDVYKVNVPFPADGAETTTNLVLPAAGFVVDCFMYVNTAEATGATKTIDVGLLSSESGGDANGFLAGASVAATGYVKGTLADGAATLGALLSTDESSGDLVPEKHLLNGTAQTVSITVGSADFAEMDVDIYFLVLVIDR